MKPNKTLVVAIVVVVVALVAWTVWKTGAPGTPQQPQRIQVGAILPLTGPTAFLGEEERKGLEAMREILRSDGLDIEIVYEDSKNEAKGAITAFNRLSHISKVKALVATHSGVNGPISEYIASSNAPLDTLPLPIGTIVASTKITANNPVFFRCYPSGKDEGRTMAAFAAQDLKISTVAIMYQNDDYGTDGCGQFTRRFVASGGSIVLSEAFPKDAGDHKSLVAKVLDTKPDGVYVIGNTPAYSLVFKQLKEAGYAGTTMSGSAMDVGKFRSLASAEGVKGLYYTSTFSPTEAIRATPRFERFVELLAENNTEPNMLNVYPAVSLEILAAAIGKGPARGTTALVAAMEKGSFDTLLGTVSFSKSRDALLPLFVKRIKGDDPASDKTLKEMSPKPVPAKAE
jgi:branched-chain amino acid transport system substrate-binding protein